MKYIFLSMAFLLPTVSLAQEQGDGTQGGGSGGNYFGEGSEISQFVNNLTEFIFGPLLILFIGIALLAFAWGVIKYFIGDAEGDKSAAKSLMLWGVLGFVLIVALFGIVNLLAGNFADAELSVPNAPTAGN